MKLRIITPKAPETTAEVTRVFLPGVCGNFEVLRGHAPLLAALGEGLVRWDDGQVRISSGFAEVKDDVIKVTAEF